MRLLRYCNPKGALQYYELSRGTRRVQDAAVNLAQIPTEANQRVQAVVEAIGRGQTYPPLIAVDSTASDMILVEG